MRRLVTRSVARLKRVELDELKACTARNAGQMMSTVDDMYNRKAGKAIILRDDDGTVAAWALVYRYAEKDDQWNDQWSAQFYTKTPYRRKGLGSKIAGSVKRQFGNVRVFPWDARSESFFEHVEMGT